MIINSNEIISNTNKCKEIAELLNNGAIMIYPTETVYGIGCDAFNDYAINRIISLKQRPAGKPLIILVKDIYMLQQLILELPTIGKALINEFWPGPLSLILNAKPSINKQLTANTGKIGVRQSPHPVVKSIFEIYNHPIVSTSANISNELAASAVCEIPTNITNNVDLIINGGKLNSIPSTVIDVTNNRIEFIREGVIKKSTIERLFL